MNKEDKRNFRELATFFTPLVLAFLAAISLFTVGRISEISDEKEIQKEKQQYIDEFPAHSREMENSNKANKPFVPNPQADSSTLRDDLFDLQTK